MEKDIYLNDSLFHILLIIILLVSIFRVSRYMNTGGETLRFYLWLGLIYSIISYFIIIEIMDEILKS
ncbi:hypothetical protein EB1_29440 [Empedobacter brevis NBRC 14943 = ATCC 43319]|uniref:Uncharacterized protein n=1 Tax=Empedobacter brevis NBRC 14943 = ATCC 43319 TaxID=1218108 RepID=A0A511NK50_9FLAO|nr:hypothetical protein EB1_29440 [Empedobacter brevis NBRC 14943 = ATCC 43319]